MEVGPTCHYVMGGVRVDADTGASTVTGLFAAGECAGGMHGADRVSHLLFVAQVGPSRAQNTAQAADAGRPPLHVPDIAA